ncbi:MAG TPA: RdgB/HAM1 family non-canonical purine NTP pyrophosphatase [Polyangiaceae bacterium]|nr:RdgB/HAM1 family non-canonical purine NTP pyrophosphatase [Polyangiaceae bacterium]
MTERRTLVLASSNPGKLEELRTLLAALPFRVISVREALGEALAVEETGDTFEANAILKARAVYLATGELSLADDSGLEVDGLEGRPGVLSARFAHPHATDAENNAALLRELGEKGNVSRRARFRCVLAWVAPGTPEPRWVQGTCEGAIASLPRGTGGFGYDPLFIVDGAGGRSFAELTAAEKHALSHRGKAVRALVEELATSGARGRSDRPAGV